MFVRIADQLKIVNVFVKSMSKYKYLFYYSTSILADENDLNRRILYIHVYWCVWAQLVCTLDFIKLPQYKWFDVCVRAIEYVFVVILVCLYFLSLPFVHFQKVTGVVYRNFWIHAVFGCVTADFICWFNKRQNS